MGNAQGKSARGVFLCVKENHLGNVLVTVSDKRLGQDVYNYTNTGAGSNYSYNALQNAYYLTPGNGTFSQSAGSDGKADWYTPDVLSYSDYYVFGAPQTGRHAGDPTRYGFNGKENDNEVKDVEGSTQDYGMPMYDPRVGRFFSVDPLMFNYPYYTPYQFAGNMPISFIDLDGCEPACPSDGSGTTFGETCKGKEGEVYTWTQYPGTDPANNQGAWLESGESMIVISSDPIMEGEVLPEVAITADASGGANNTIDPADPFGWFSYKVDAIEYGDNDTWVQNTGTFASNVGIAIVNMVIGTAQAIGQRGPGAAYDYIPATIEGVYGNVKSIRNGTYIEETISNFSNVHNWENATAQVVVIAASGRYFKVPVAAEGLAAEELTLKPYTKSNMKLGREMHAEYKTDLHNPEAGLFKEFNKVPGIRPDFVDFNTRTIFELKPYNPRGITGGMKQLNNYQGIMQEYYPGSQWKIQLDHY